MRPGRGRFGNGDGYENGYGYENGDEYENTKGQQTKGSLQLGSDYLLIRVARSHAVLPRRKTTYKVGPV